MRTGGTGRWRRLIGATAGATGAALLAVVSVLPAAANTAPHTGVPTRPVDRDIERYVLFAFENLLFKGGNGTDWGFVRGGNVGVNEPGEYRGGPRLEPCTNHDLVMDDGTQLVGDVARLAPQHCDVWDAYVNDIVGGGSVSPRNSGPNAFTAPIIPRNQLPVLPQMACNPAAPVTVDQNASVALPPGVYGDLRVNDRGTLTLSAGTYTFCRWSLGKQTTVNTVSGLTAKVQGRFTSNDGSYVGPACDAQFFVKGEKDPANGNHSHDDNLNDIAFSHGGNWYGRYYAPNGDLNLGGNGEHHGRFWAKFISGDPNHNIDGCEPPSSSTTTSSTTTSSTTTSSTTTSTSTTSTSTTVPGSTTSVAPTTVVISTSTTDPTVTTGGTTTPSVPGSTTPGSPQGPLAFTGSRGVLLWLGLALLAGGSTLLAVRRRRRLADV